MWGESLLLLGFSYYFAISRLLLAAFTGLCRTLRPKGGGSRLKGVRFVSEAQNRKGQMGVLWSGAASQGGYSTQSWVSTMKLM